MEVWNIGYRFNPRTGNIKPWEVVNTVTVNGKTTAKNQWGSFKSEAAAAASIPRDIAKMAGTSTHGHVTAVNVGRCR